jgi:K+-transporting ATPase ATPase C chain
MAQVRAMAWLLGLTVLVVCVIYPLCLWVVGQTVFPTRAAGSLIDAEGNPTTDPSKARGSRLIAQPFKQARYFQPRPSAVGYSAGPMPSSGGSNLAASNPLLRDRVARQLGPIVRFEKGDRAGQRVGPVVQEWFIEQPDGFLGKWAKQNPTLAQRWVKDDDNKKGVLAWLKAPPSMLEDWRKKQDPAPEKAVFDKALGDPNHPLVAKALDDLAVPFFEHFAQTYPKQVKKVKGKKEVTAFWPIPSQLKLPNGEIRDTLAARSIQRNDTAITDLQAVMFDPWLAAHPEQAGNIKKVPADMVLASGSGLDPHITRRNANYQLPDVIAARAKDSGVDRHEVKWRIEEILDQHSFRPFGFLGDELVNVVEVNIEMDRMLPSAPLGSNFHE